MAAAAATSADEKGLLSFQGHKIKKPGSRELSDSGYQSKMTLTTAAAPVARRVAMTAVAKKRTTR